MFLSLNDCVSLGDRLKRLETVHERFWSWTCRCSKSCSLNDLEGRISIVNHKMYTVKCTVIYLMQVEMNMCTYVNPFLRPIEVTSYFTLKLLGFVWICSLFLFAISISDALLLSNHLLHTVLDHLITLGWLLIFKRNFLKHVIFQHPRLRK